jgi:hypothetical protein
MGADTGMGETPPPPPSDMEMPQPNIDDEDIEEKKPTGPTGLKTIQKLTGRLSQRLRTFDELESEDIKYVMNSIISALDLTKLDDDDRDNILDKLESFDEYGKEDEGELDLSDEDLSLNEPTSPEGDMSGGMEPPVTESRVQQVLSQYFEFKPSERKKIEENKKVNFLKNKLQKNNIKKEIQSLSESLIQMETAFGLLDENAKFVGKTNKENLIFTKNGNQYKVTPNGRVL